MKTMLNETITTFGDKMNQIPMTQQECWEMDCSDCALYDVGFCRDIRRDLTRYYHRKMVDKI